MSWKREGGGSRSRLDANRLERFELHRLACGGVAPPGVLLSLGVWGLGRVGVASGGAGVQLGRPIRVQAQQLQQKLTGSVAHSP